MRPPHTFYYVFWAQGDAVMCGLHCHCLKEERECVVDGEVGVRSRRKAVCNR